MRYLLDTTALIDQSHGHPGVAALLESLFAEPNDLYTCDVVVAEALSGGSDLELRTVRTLVQVLEYVATHPDAAAWAGERRRERRVAGRGSLGDALIGGVAWHLGATVVTRNPRDFEALGVPVLAYE